jgi:monoterpene epsilon-lactone hydrolase
MTGFGSGGMSLQNRDDFLTPAFCNAGLFLIYGIQWSGSRTFLSIQNTLLKFILRSVNFKKLLIKLFRNPKRGLNHFHSKKFSSRRFSVEESSVKDFKILTVKPKVHQSKGHILFLHGGAYVLEAGKHHQRMVKELVRDTHFTCSFFDYPLAPEFSYQEAIERVLEVYELLSKKNPEELFCLFGDSAGGGMALSLLQQIRDKGISPKPQKTILSSPWLDLSLSHERIMEFSDKDLILSVESLSVSAKYYARGLSDLKDSKVSPMFGSGKDLGDILLLYSDEEIFTPDCEDLIRQWKDESGTTIESIIGPGLVHDWIMFTSPESTQTMKQIAKFLTK